MQSGQIGPPAVRAGDAGLAVGVAVAGGHAAATLAALASRPKRARRAATPSIGSRVGVREPPLGSSVTSTCSTPSSDPGTSTVAEPSRAASNSDVVGSGACRRAVEPDLVDAAGGRRGQVARRRASRWPSAHLERRAARRAARPGRRSCAGRSPLPPSRARRRRTPTRAAATAPRARAPGAATQPAPAAAALGGGAGAAGRPPGRRRAAARPRARRSAMIRRLQRRRRARAARPTRAARRRRRCSSSTSARQAAQLVEVRLEAGGLVVGQRAEHVGAGGVGPALVIRPAVMLDGISAAAQLRRASSPGRAASGPSRCRPASRASRRSPCA